MIEFTRAMRTRGSAAVLFVGGAVSCFAAGASDNFNDGVIADLWETVQLPPNVVNLNETNGRLELSAFPNATLYGVGGYASNTFFFDLNQDFRWRVDWRFVPPAGTDGDLGIELICLGLGDLTDGLTGIDTFIGRDFFGPYIQFDRVEFNNTLLSNGHSNAGNTTGTMYYWYDAASDTLFVSETEFDDPTPGISLPNFRATVNTDIAGVFIGGFSDPGSPAMSGSDTWLDNFVVEEHPCVGDLNGDGVVNAVDLAQLLGAWTGNSPLGDLDCNGVVAGPDLAILLGTWGPCP